MLDARSLTYRYKLPDGRTIEAVKQVSVAVSPGEILAVLGANGSGKSTLARLLSSLTLPDEGSVYVDGVRTHRRLTRSPGGADRLQHKVGMVFQNPDNQLIATSVTEDVAFGPENLGVPPDEIRERIDWALGLVSMSDYADHEPHNLSAGEKQRVAIAGILAMRPRYLVLDEVTSMLDPRGRREVIEAVAALRDQGLGIVYVTHFVNEATAADRVAVLADGRLVGEGKTKDILPALDRLECGLQPPSATLLARELARAGLDVPLDALDMEEVAESLCCSN